MSLLSKVTRCMKTIAPLELAETSWDNVGVLVEPPFPCPKQSKVLLTIDLTHKVLEEALSDPKIGTIVSYHPPIFSSMKRLTSADVKQDIILKAIARGVGIYSPHTACDNCENGVNDWLASGLGQGTSAPITPSVNPPVGQEQSGSGRIFRFSSPTDLMTVVERVKKLTGLRHLRLATAENNTLVSSVAICAGSGSSVLGPVTADVYLTGEMGHHDVLAALAKNTSVILCEHTNTERGYLSAILQPALQSALAKETSQEGGEAIQVLVSKCDQDPLVII